MMLILNLHPLVAGRRPGGATSVTLAGSARRPGNGRTDLRINRLTAAIGGGTAVAGTEASANKQPRP
jgi:hypothetical protein